MSKFLARPPPAPIDFGKSDIEFLESQNGPLAQPDGEGPTDKIYQRHSAIHGGRQTVEARLPQPRPNDIGT